MTDAITASGTTAGSAPWRTRPETPRVERTGAVLRTVVSMREKNAAGL
jgi:hypothetical protein